MTKMDPQERYVRGLQHALRTLDNNADDLGWVERDMARDAVSKALAAVQCDGRGAPSGQSGWQPIETAPKDGTAILGFWAGDVINERNYALTLYRTGSWWDADRGREEYGEPTHWMPLPAPPTGGGSGSMDAAPATGQSRTSEAPLADAQSGARPNSPETLQLLQQAAEALEDHLESLDAYPEPLVPVNRTRGTTTQLRVVAAALRALGER
jgi:hypothetical protein